MLLLWPCDVFGVLHNPRTYFPKYFLLVWFRCVRHFDSCIVMDNTTYTHVSEMQEGNYMCYTIIDDTWHKSNEYHLFILKRLRVVNFKHSDVSGVIQILCSLHQSL